MRKRGQFANQHGHLIGASDSEAKMSVPAVSIASLVDLLNQQALGSEFFSDLPGGIGNQRSGEATLFFVNSDVVVQRHANSEEPQKRSRKAGPEYFSAAISLTEGSGSGHNEPQPFCNYLSYECA